MPVRKILSYISLGILLFAVIIIALSFRGSGVGKADTDEIIGRELEYKVFDSDNRLAIYITSSSSRRDFDPSREPAQRDRTLLKDIRGTIYKGEKFKNDLTFSGRSGYVENEYKNFMLRENAKIESRDIRLTSDYFFMKGNSLISNRNPTEFKLESLEGIARRGIKYHMTIGALDLFNASGSYIRSGKKYRFRCRRLMVLKKYNRLVFKGNAEIQGTDSVIRGREIILKFSKDFKRLHRTDVRKKAYFRTAGKKKGEFREMSGKAIFATFGEGGEIRKIDISKNGKLIIRQEGSRLEARSKLIYLRFDNETSRLSQVKLMRGGRVISSGKRSFDINSRRIRVTFDHKGDINLCATHGETSFKMGDYSGTTPRLIYRPPRELITLKGEKSEIRKGENRFVSGEFSVNTKEGKLSSGEDITSVIQLETGNSVFSKSPVFVHSKKVEIDDRTGSVTYREEVSLFQGETVLNSDKFHIGQNNKIRVSGSVKLEFKNGENEIRVKGNELTIDSEDSSMEVLENTVLQEGENSLQGGKIRIEFNKKNEIGVIQGEKDIEFNRKEISGKSENVEWDFRQKIITFLSKASLKKSSSGTSRGEKIVFHMESEKVVIESGDGKRSETKLD